MKIDHSLKIQSLKRSLEAFWKLSAEKILRLEKRWKQNDGSPVFTIRGKYSARGWTEWTQGFQYGSAILQFDATGESVFLDLGRCQTVARMAGHLSHLGVHDHGFNNVSTYGNLWRLMNEGRLKENAWERAYYELALKVSGAVQASRWTQLPDGLGFIYSFNGPHSLFADTIRSLRVLGVSHQLGHCLMGEKDRKINLLERLLIHAETTARYHVCLGNGRDFYDVRGRVVHESIFNVNDGSYRCPNSQQGYAPFSTWTRGLSWILLGFAEQLEFLSGLPAEKFPDAFPKNRVCPRFLQIAEAVADFWMAHTPTDGIPYWDTGAPDLWRLGDWRSVPSDPWNNFEPVDSSAAVIAAQGFLRLARCVRGKKASFYRQAGLTLARHLLSEPYLSDREHHEGMILHSVYHRPNGWDYTKKSHRVPHGESSMWGDYHARELALMLWRELHHRPSFCFYN